jgi:FkbM family methyltransferase
MNDAIQPIFQRAARLIGTPRGLFHIARLLGRTFSARRFASARLKNGRSLVVDLTDPASFPLFLNGTIPHEQEEITLLRKLLRPGDVFVDVGANVGFYIAEALPLVGPHGLVIAIEPTPNCMRLLRMSFGSVPNVVLLEAAAFDRSGTATFHVSKSTALSSLASLDPKAHDVEVRLTTLDEEFRSHQWPAPNVIKIDVEGAELAVLRGARALLTSAKAPAVLFEYGNGLAEKFGFSFEDIKEALGPTYSLNQIGHQNDWFAHAERSQVEGVLPGP